MSETKSDEWGEERTAEELLEFLYATPVGVIGFRNDGSIQFINPIACNLVLPTLDRPVFEDVYTALRAVCPELRELVDVFHRPSGLMYERRIQSVAAGSEVRYYSLLINKIKNDMNMAVIEDVTELERINDRLRHVQRLESLGRLTAEVTHDFNNILQGIGISAAVIDRQPMINSIARECLNTIRGAVAHGANVVRRLLAFAGMRPLKPLPTPIADVMADLQKLVGHGGACTVSIHNDSSIAGLQVLVDATELLSSMVNLVSNARDAMPDGGSIKVHIDRPSERVVKRAGLQNGRYLRIAVIDVGSGMTDEVRRRASEPFFTTKAPGQGAGIGLASVCAFADQCGGAVQIDSLIGRGTTVTLWLPVAE